MWTAESRSRRGRSSVSRAFEDAADPAGSYVDSSPAAHSRLHLASLELEPAGSAHLALDLERRRPAARVLLREPERVDLIACSEVGVEQHAAVFRSVAQLEECEVDPLLRPLPCDVDLVLAVRGVDDPDRWGPAARGEQRALDDVEAGDDCSRRHEESGAGGRGIDVDAHRGRAQEVLDRQARHCSLASRLFPFERDLQRRAARALDEQPRQLPRLDPDVDAELEGRLVRLQLGERLRQLARNCPNRLDDAVERRLRDGDIGLAIAGSLNFELYRRVVDLDGDDVPFRCSASSRDDPVRSSDRARRRRRLAAGEHASRVFGCRQARGR